MDSKLSKIEMACLTACVPCSGDLAIDKIIHVSLRLKLATQFLEGMLAGNSGNVSEVRALELADLLLKQFEGKQPE